MVNPMPRVHLDVQGLGRACTGIEVSVYRDLYPKPYYVYILIQYYIEIMLAVTDDDIFSEFSILVAGGIYFTKI